MQREYMIVSEVNSMEILGVSIHCDFLCCMVGILGSTLVLAASLLSYLSTHADKALMALLQGSNWWQNIRTFPDSYSPWPAYGWIQCYKGSDCRTNITVPAPFCQTECFGANYCNRTSKEQQCWAVSHKKC